MAVSLQEDEFVCRRGISQAQWLATLSDGTTVYQDDGRPGLEGEPSAWLRLRQHVLENDLDIVGIRLRFRSLVLSPLPDEADGYFWRREMGTFLRSGKMLSFYLLGYLKDKKVVVQRWSVPALSPVGLEERDPDDAVAVGESLILSGGRRS